MKARARSLAEGAALVVLTLLAYANSFSAGLVFDNTAIILGDARLRATAWTDVAKIFTESYWWPQFTSNLYRPLTTLSYWVNYTVLGHGTAPAGYHVVNFALHAANALLVWRLALRLGARTGVAWLAAAIFAVHPLGVEAVTNIVGRADLFATLAVLTVSLAWLRAREAATPARARGWRAFAGLVAFLAVFAKENGILAVAAVGLLEWREHGWRRAPGVLLRQALPYFLPALVAITAIRFAMREYAPPLPVPFVNNPIAYLGAWEGTMTALNVAARSLALVVWPAQLSCDYSYPQIPLYGGGGWGVAQAWLALAAIVALAFAIWRSRAAAPLFAFGAAWGVVMMLPTSNLLVRIGSIMAERFLYLPLTGFALAGAVLLGVAGERLAARIRPAAALALAAACLAALAVRTLVRNADWRDEISLWRSAVRVCPRSFNTHKGLGSSLFGSGQSEAATDAAIASAERGLPLLENPPLPTERQDNSLWGDLGQYYRVKGGFVLARGDQAGARVWFEKSLAILDRAYAMDRWVNDEARRRLLAKGRAEGDILEVGYPPIHIQRAQTLLQLGRRNEALAMILAMQRFAPLEIDGLALLGFIDRTNGDWEIAAVRFVEILLLDNTNAIAWRELEAIYAHLGISPFPVQVVAGRRVFDASSPRLRTQINTALRDMVGLLRAARHHRDADIWIERATRVYECPPEIFADLQRK